MPNQAGGQGLLHPPPRRGRKRTVAGSGRHKASGAAGEDRIEQVHLAILMQVENVHFGQLGQPNGAEARTGFRCFAQARRKHHPIRHDATHKAMFGRLEGVERGGVWR